MLRKKDSPFWNCAAQATKEVESWPSWKKGNYNVLKAIDVRWTSKVNQYLIQCSCGKNFWHNMNRWWVVCPQCRTKKNIEYIREQFMKDNPA